MSEAVHFHHLSFTYTGESDSALERIEGAIQDGAFVVVLGHSGAGKSTLCRTVNGLIPHFLHGIYEGRVTVKGRDVVHSNMTDLTKTAGLVFQDFEAQLFSSTVELEMAFGPENQRLCRADIEDRIVRHLNFVGLARQRKRETATLSGGEKQRLCIGSVLAAEPSILLLDEPATDLDPAGRQSVLSLATSLREKGRTLIMVDESAQTAVHADQVWLMNEGKLAFLGPPQAILADANRLEACGIKAIPTVALFSALGWPGRPLTVEDALILLKENPLCPPRRPVSFPARRSSSESPLLQAENVSYRYPTGAEMVLRNVCLDVRQGEFLALLGRNGSGKTTLAKHFNGLLRPTSGRILLAGRPTTAYRRHELARQVGYVFQNPDHQIFAPTVREEIGFGLHALGETRKAVDRAVDEVMEQTGLAGYGSRPPFSLSRGEKQRVAVASVLAVKPRILVLDEPTTGLDYRHQRDAMEMLKQLHRSGHTVLVITHAMEIAEAYADRVLVMKEGVIAADGPTRLLFSDESLLADASLQPSPLARLSNHLGLASLTLEGMIAELREERL